MTQLCFLLLYFSFFPFLFFLFEYLQSVFSVFFSLSWRLACCILGSRPLLYRHHNIGHHCPFGLRYKIKFQQQQQLHADACNTGVDICTYGFAVRADIGRYSVPAPGKIAIPQPRFFPRFLRFFKRPRFPRFSRVF